MLFDSNVAVCACRAAGIAVVAAQVLLLMVHSSAVASVPVVFTPPVTSTWPCVTVAGVLVNETDIDGLAERMRTESRTFAAFRPLPASSSDLVQPKLAAPT